MSIEAYCEECGEDLKVTESEIAVDRGDELEIMVTVEPCEICCEEE